MAEHGAPDEYEKKYMGGEAPLARSRLPMPWWFSALILVPGASAIAGAVGTGALVPLALLPLLLVTWILFLYLRVNVTASHVNVQFGLFGPKIPIETILDAKVVPYSFVRYGGWGIRYSLDGSTAYSVPGHGGRGLEIAFKKKNGKTKTVFVSSDTPEELLAAIQKARGGAGVRVEAEEAKAGPRIVEEEFASAEEEDERAKGKGAR